MALMDYSPHALIGLAATALGYTFRQHVKTDDDRYTQLTKQLKDVADKIDDNDKEAARRHEYLVNTLLLKRG